MIFLKKYISKSLNFLFPGYMELRAFKVQEKVLNKIKSDFLKLPNEKLPETVKEYYFKNTGNQLDLENPKRFTEKIQWRKLYDQDDVYSYLSDKWEVRKWISKKIGEKYLIPLAYDGIWNMPEEINYNLLPNQFVIKTNNGSGTNIIVKDKSKLNKQLANRKLKFWFNYCHASIGYELHYLKIKPCIYAENYISPNDGESDIKDYKFLCFSGEPYYCWVDMNRYSNHKRQIFDMKWKPQKWQSHYYEYPSELLQKPKAWDEMLDVVKVLCKGFAHVRVDLYDSDGKIYFGEMTFTSGNGIECPHPDEWDYRLGDLWDISKPQIDYDLVDI